MKKLSILISLLFVASAASAAISSVDSAELLIPVAGLVTGANGETFVTDLTLVNLSEEDQRVELVWLPEGGTSAPVTRTLTLGARRFADYDDVASSVFGVSGLGSILIRAIDNAGQLDADSALDAHARIWSGSRCGLGSLSQSVPSVRFEGWRNGSAAYVHGARSSDQFRANYGIVNLTGQAREFRVVINSQFGRRDLTVTVPANGLFQSRVPDGLGEGLSMAFTPLTGSGRWYAYGVSVDNFSGASWTIPATQPRADLIPR